MSLVFVALAKSLKNVAELYNKNVTNMITKNKKMGRNEPCFCGSGKKFKHCHGAL